MTRKAEALRETCLKQVAKQLPFQDLAQIDYVPSLFFVLEVTNCDLKQQAGIPPWERL